MPNILRNCIGNNVGNALTKLRRQRSPLSADWLYHSLPAGVSPWEVDLGFTDCLHSRLPPTRNESCEVQISLGASNGNGAVSSWRLFSHGFLLALSKWEPPPLTATQAGQPNTDFVLGPLVLQVQVLVPVEHTG